MGHIISRKYLEVIVEPSLKRRYLNEDSMSLYQAWEDREKSIPGREKRMH